MDVDSDGVLTALASDHSSLFVFILQSVGGGDGALGSLKVFGSDGGRNGRRVCAFDVLRIWLPASSTKGRVVQDIGIERDETLADAVLDVMEVSGA